MKRILFCRHMAMVLLAAVIVLSGCAGMRRRAFAPESARYDGPLDWPSIHAWLKARDPAVPVQTLQSEWKITLTAPEGAGRTALRANVLLEPPDHVRFRAYKVATLVMDLLVEGPDVMIHDRLENKIYKGSTLELREHEWVLSQLNPGQLSQLLLIEQYLRDGLAEGWFYEAPGPARRSATGHIVLLTAGVGGPLVEALAVRPDTLLVERVGLYRQDGTQLKRLPLQVDYEQYRLYDGWLLPRRLRLSNTQTGGSILLEASHYSINPPLHPKTFVMPVRDSTPVLPLSTLWSR
ncbi:MAG: hypothetical protein Kow0059_00650 [Candidatus Sumerlaeia bacterium]